MKTKNNSESFSDLFRITSHSDIYNTIFPEIPWLINELIGPGLTLLAGPPKVGKSWLCLQLAKSVALGEDFLGKKAKKGKVIYFALEDSHRRIRERTINQNWSPTKNVDFLDTGQFSLMKKEDQTLSEKFYQAVRSSDYKLIIFDTFSRSFEINQNKSEEVSRVINPLQEFAHEMDMSILLIDHHKKPGSHIPSDPIFDVLGSTAKTGTADTILGLYKKNIKSAILKGFGRDIGPVDHILLFDSSRGIWDIEEESQIRKLGRQQRRVLEFLKTKKKVQQIKISKKLDLPKDQVHKILHRLEELGLTKSKRKKDLVFWSSTSLN